MSVQWHYELEDIPELGGDFDGATAAHAKAVLAIDCWNNELKYMDRYHGAYDETKKTVAKWKACKEKAAGIIKTYQLSLF